MADKEYGKFLKTLRIQKEEYLQDMAKNLGIQSSYLSAIESGTRDIPVDLTQKICKEYNLSDEDSAKLHTLELNRERKAVQLDFEKIKDNALAKETVLNFASKFADLSSEQLESINKILNGGE